MAASSSKSTGIGSWLRARWPIDAVVRWALDEPIPGGASFAYVLGSLTLFLFVLQALTGMWQMLYYSPSTDHAYTSVAYLRLEVPFGWLIYGLHYWGANAFIVVIILHMIRVVVWGAYKRPRELTWLLGMVLLAVGAGLYFTGALLPHDEAGFWAAEVGSSIAGTVPLVGGFIEAMLRGGGTMGQLTLVRFFVLHVAILPALGGLFILAHLVAFRQYGSVGSWNPQRRRTVGAFWPDQVFKDLVVIALVLLLLVGLSAFSPPPFTGPADLLDSTYVPKPEWAFLSLYQLLKAFPGALEPVATVGAPGLLGLLLVLLPFLDRHPERHPWRRPVVMGVGVAILVSVIGLTIAGASSNPEAGAGRPAVAQAPPPASVQPDSRSPRSLPPAAAEGHKVMATVGCLGCHTVDGTGGKVGPNLSNEGGKGRTHDWLMAQLRDPRSHFPNTVMPSFASLDKAQREHIVAFLLTRHTAGKATPARAGAVARTVPPPVASGSLPAHGMQGPPGPAADMIGNFAHGRRLFATYCTACHGADGKGGIPNPGSTAGHVPALNPIEPTLFSSDPHRFASNLDRFLQHGSVPEGDHPALRMPPFGQSAALTQPEIANIEAYLLGLNGVNRARIDHPGIAPGRFFLIFLAALAVLALLLGALRLNRRGRP